MIEEMKDENGRTFGNVIQEDWPGCWRVHPDCAKVFIRRLARRLHQWEPNSSVLQELGDYNDKQR